jgi:hypothetical protein
MQEFAPPAMKLPLVFAAAVSFLTCAVVHAGEAGFIRVEEDAKAARLETAITRYAKNGATVDLIGAVHIGDKAYYQALNQRFTTYQVVLFEMIGGEAINVPPPPGEQPAPNLLRTLYGGIAKKLKLAGQVDVIDYTAKNFVHADLTAAEFAQKQTDRDESIFKFMLKSEDSAKQPDSLKFLIAAISGRADLLKLAVIDTLGAGDDQVASIAGENVIIADRNARCLEVLDRQLAVGRQNIGIFYGAAHFPDMEKRLLDQGFTRVDQSWLTAWNVLKPIKKTASPPAAVSRPD